MTYAEGTIITNNYICWRQTIPISFRTKRTDDFLRLHITGRNVICQQVNYWAAFSFRPFNFQSTRVMEFLWKLATRELVCVVRPAEPCGDPDARGWIIEALYKKCQAGTRSRASMSRLINWCRATRSLSCEWRRCEGDGFVFQHNYKRRPIFFQELVYVYLQDTDLIFSLYGFMGTHCITGFANNFINFPLKGIFWVTGYKVSC